jgi:hypothetical protein
MKRFNYVWISIVVVLWAGICLAKPPVPPGPWLVVTGGLSYVGNVNITGAFDCTGDLDVDNININGNTISSTDLNGNITLSPNGTGDVVIDGTDWTVDADGNATVVSMTIPPSPNPGYSAYDIDGTDPDLNGKTDGNLSVTTSDGEYMDWPRHWAQIDGTLTKHYEFLAEDRAHVFIIGHIASTPVTEAFTTEADLTDPLTSSIVLLDGDNDADNDTLDLQDGTTAGQHLHLIAAADIDANDTATISYADTTCTNCAATVFDKVGENVYLIWTGATWVQVSLIDGL